MQDEDRPLLDREPAERPLQFVAVGEVVARVRRGEPVHGQHADGRDPGSSPLRLVVAGMDEDPMDPRFELVRIPELRESPPGEHEGVLQRVLGETRVAQDPVSNRVERVADLVHQDGERLAIPLSGPLDEVSIHPRPPVAAASMAADYPL